MGYRLDRPGCRTGTGSGSCDCGNEPSGSIKCGEFLD
jgi:hypothetical protein